MREKKQSILGLMEKEYKKSFTLKKYVYEGTSSKVIDACIRIHLSSNTEFMLDFTVCKGNNNVAFTGLWRLI